MAELHTPTTSDGWNDEGDCWTAPDGGLWGTSRIVDPQYRRDGETRWPDCQMWSSERYAHSLKVTEYTASHVPGRIRMLEVLFDGEDRHVWHLGDVAEWQGKIVIYDAGKALHLTIADVPLLINDGSLITYSKVAELLNLTVGGVKTLIHAGDLKPVARRGWPVYFSKAVVLALKKLRNEAESLRLNACVSALAAFFRDEQSNRDVLRERNDVFRELRKRYSEDTIYAAKRKLKIVVIRKSPGPWKWALPGTEIPPDQGADPPQIGEVFSNSRGRWPTARQIKAIYGMPIPTCRGWARRDSIRHGGKALRSRIVRSPVPTAGRQRYRGYLERDLLDIFEGREYRRCTGMGPGPIHARLQMAKFLKAKQQLLEIIPKGSPIYAGTALDTLVKLGISRYVATAALYALGGKKTSTTETWSKSKRPGRAVWWWSLPDNAYERAKNGAPTRTASTPYLGNVEAGKLTPQGMSKAPSIADEPAKLAGSALRAFNYISKNPGAIGKTIAKAIGVSRGHFRKVLVPILKAHGVCNDGSGYYRK